MAANQWFKNVDVAPKIEVFALIQAYNDDQDTKKVNLSAGGKYRKSMYGAIVQ